MFGLTKIIKPKDEQEINEEVKQEVKQDAAYWQDLCAKIEMTEIQDQAEVAKLESRIEQIQIETGNLLNRERLDDDAEASTAREGLEIEFSEAQARIKRLRIAQADLIQRKRRANICYHEQLVKELKQKFETTDVEVIAEFKQIRFDVRKMRIKERYATLLALLNEGDRLRMQHNQTIGFLGSGQRVPERAARPGRMEPALFWDDI